MILEKILETNFKVNTHLLSVPFGSSDKEFEHLEYLNFNLNGLPLEVISNMNRALIDALASHYLYNHCEEDGRAEDFLEKKAHLVELIKKSLFKKLSQEQQ